jgi:hypothetical protein
MQRNLKTIIELFSKRDFQKALVASLITVLLFVLYVVLYGHPATEARNQYNAAYRNFQQGEIESAKKHLEKSLEIMETRDAILLLEEIENQPN